MSTALSREVEKFTNRYKAVQAEKDSEKAHQLALAPRREIVEAPTRQHTAFWCNLCQRDYHATGTKLVEGEGKTASAVYRSECPDGHHNYRYITDIGHDPYFIRSHNVQRDRAKYADYLLSPHDDRFKHVYRTQWLEHERRRELADAGHTSGGR